MTNPDRLEYPWPCPSCGGPLVLGAAGRSATDTFVAVICEAEDIAFEEAAS